MRLLDLYCGAGGAAMGYHRAGFDEIVGVDISHQPHYPFEFVQGDALEELARLGEFDAIHASPPCQRYSITKNLTKTKGSEHPDLLAPTRDMLQKAGLPYVIENVQGAPLLDPVKLCGSSFGLDVRRHRLFESSIPLIAPPCAHAWQTPRFLTQRGRGHKSQQRLASVVNVSGHDTSFTHYMSSVVHVQGSSGGKGGVELWKQAMGIDWMLRDELAQAIPPAFTECIGLQLVAWIQSKRKAPTAAGAFH